MANKTVYVLTVEYPGHSPILDAAIREEATKRKAGRETGCGFYFGNPDTRDISFDYKRKDSALRAEVRVRTLKSIERKLRTRVEKEIL